MSSVKESWAWFKSHPLALGALVVVVGLLLLWIFFRRGSAGAASGSSDLAAYYAATTASTQAGAAAQVAQIQATQGLAADQLAAGVQQSSIAAQLEAFKNGNASAVSVAQISGDVAKYGISANENIQTGQTAAALSLGTAQTAAALQLGTKQADTVSYINFVNQYADLEKFVASPAAGMTQGTAWGGLPLPNSFKAA